MNTPAELRQRFKDETKKDLWLTNYSTDCQFSEEYVFYLESKIKNIENEIVVSDAASKHGVYSVVGDSNASGATNTDGEHTNGAGLEKRTSGGYFHCHDKSNASMQGKTVPKCIEQCKLCMEMKPE